MLEDRTISCEAEVPASLDAVWEAWTTEEGARTFFAPRCRIDLRPRGSYEMLFDLTEKPGRQGGEGMIVLALQPRRMLAFTWNAPPHLSEVRGHMTHVVVRMTEIEPGKTRVRLTHDGWGEGGEWEEAHAYFSRAWAKVVLPRLVHRFRKGPIDWENPPRPEDLSLEEEPA